MTVRLLAVENSMDEIQTSMDNMHLLMGTMAQLEQLVNQHKLYSAWKTKETLDLELKNKILFKEVEDTTQTQRKIISLKETEGRIDNKDFKSHIFKIKIPNLLWMRVIFETLPRRKEFFKKKSSPKSRRTSTR